MNHFQKVLFDKIQQNSNIRPEDIFKVAESVKNADFSDEQTVRKLVRHLARLADKPISKEKEDKIVKSITKNDVPSDLSTLQQMFKK